MKNKPTTKGITVYQTKDGAIEFLGDFKHETIWATLGQIANLFNVQKPAISKHLKNIYQEKELKEKATVSILETVQKEGERQIKRKIEYYNLDAILSVGYRVDSRQATQFRIWATKTLKQHLLKGYSINKNRIGLNYKNFMQALGNIKALLPSSNIVKTEDVLELVSIFANTWFSLNAYDKNSLPVAGMTKKQVIFTAEELCEALLKLKNDLLKKQEATNIFGQERQNGNVKGIVGNIFQSVFGKDAYQSLEEKAAHLLYFMVKNHPFVDGNKRSGAFAFVWFLRKTEILQASLTPEALTVVTLLIAESKSSDKDKMIGLVLLLLNK